MKAKKQVFLIGAMKAGTTSIFNLLSQSPYVYQSKHKEPTFYNTNEFRYGINCHLQRQYNWHNSSDSNKLQNGIYLEGNNMNLVCKYVAKRIKSVHEDPKFIVCVRNPSDRAFSHWNMQNNYRAGYTFPDYLKALQGNLSVFEPDIFTFEYERMNSYDGYNECYRPTFIEQGLYYHNIMPYVKEFGKDSIHVIHFDCIKEDCRKMRLELFDFLEIDYIDSPMPWARNDSEIKKPGTIAIVEDIWKKDAQKLPELLDKDFVGKWYE